MKKLIVLLALVAVTSIAAGARAHVAKAWCWPTCSTYGVLGPQTPANSNCWYGWGEVCSGWNYWTVNGIDKRCWPICINGWTQARLLYGFENFNTIRGRFTDMAGTFYVRPSDLSMGGYLRAQVNWWPYAYQMSYASLLNAAAL
jgi:hypothetical protein